MKVKIKIREYQGKGGLMGFADVTFEHDWFALKTWGWQIMKDGRTGLPYVRTKQEKGKDGIYRDRNYCPLTQVTRLHIQRAILLSYNAIKANNIAINTYSYDITKDQVSEMIEKSKT